MKLVLYVHKRSGDMENPIVQDMQSVITLLSNTKVQKTYEYFHILRDVDVSKFQSLH